METLEVIPDPISLIESMRAVGYSVEAAIADLVDNSISARADVIEIKYDASDDPFVAILDNGWGMAPDELTNAMRHGSGNPTDAREPDDLGRFGLGLKTASLSQCRKLTVVTFRQIRFVASSSAAAALRMKSRESGAGRFTDFMLPPLTFAEYLQFAGREDALIIESPGDGALPQYRATSIEELNREFIHYLNFGGFPEAVMNPAVRENPSRFLREDIVEKVLLKDLPSLYGISDTQELNRFFNVLAYNTGDEVSPENLSRDTGIGRARLMDYLEYLEASFLIKRMHRLDENARRMKRARTFKVYLTNPSIRAALFGYVDSHDEAIGSLAETAVFSQWLHSTRTIESLHYARWKQGRSDLEVDLVSLDPRTQKPRFAVEIKWSDACFSDWSLLRGIRALATEHALARPPVVTTLTASGMGEENGVRIEFIPTSLHCYTIARNVLRMEV